MTNGTMSHWGWGLAEKFPAREARRAIGEQLRALLGFEELRLEDPVALDAIELPPSRLQAPPLLAPLCRSDHESRVRHTYGRGYRDLIRGLGGRFEAAPDLVAHPRSPEDVVALLDWGSSAGVAVIPWGGGTSVVAGTEADVGPGFAGTMSLDLRGLNRVLEVDTRSRAAHIEAGATGPGLEAALAESGLTLRHFPQSFEFSTLGGWIATRSGGHFATGPTHIDDFVEATRMVTPAGMLETRRLPASGAGPSPDRLVIGSEGALGVIVDAWVRVQARPEFHSTASCYFADFGRAVEAVRALAQSGLQPSNCRLLDKREARLNAVVGDGSHVLIVAFESADHPCDAWMTRALEIVGSCDGRCPNGSTHRVRGEAPRGRGAGAWRSAFFEAPYLQNVLVSLGVIADTFETACTWDRFESLHAAVVREVRGAMRRVCGQGFLSCRFTHVYPDGPAPYFTFLAPSQPGRELEQWAEIKAVASDVLVAEGATITHHHAVGRLHRPWYETQRSDLFAKALAAAKHAVDPAGIMNPGVLLRAGLRS